MSFNAVDIYHAERKRFIAKRGSDHGPYGAVPRATWRDVYEFGATFLFKLSNYAPEACARKTMGHPMSAQTVSVLDMVAGRTDCPSGFVETSSYKRALRSFESQQPFARLWAQNMITAPAMLIAKTATSEVYPWNEAFWDSANAFAIARNAAGVVPGKWDLAWESIVEATQELPATVAGGVDLASKVMGTAIRTLIKWGLIAVVVVFVGPPLLEKITKKLK